jgi:hypothetical protein
MRPPPISIVRPAEMHGLCGVGIPLLPLIDDVEGVFRPTSRCDATDGAFVGHRS